MAPVIVWRHYSGVTNEDGICWVQALSNGPGTHPLTGGGYAAPLVDANGSSTDTIGTDAHGQVPLAGLRVSYDPNTGSTYLLVGFAAAPGTSLRCHVFALFPDTT